MKEDNNRDYSRLTIIAGFCGLRPSEDSEGFYYFENYPHVKIDLSACAEDEKSIMRTAINQMAERLDNIWHDGVERDLSDWD